MRVSSKLTSTILNIYILVQTCSEVKLLPQPVCLYHLILQRSLQQCNCSVICRVTTNLKCKCCARLYNCDYVHKHKLAMHRQQETIQIITFTFIRRINSHNFSLTSNFYFFNFSNFNPASSPVQTDTVVTYESQTGFNCYLT